MTIDLSTFSRQQLDVLILQAEQYKKELDKVRIAQMREEIQAWIGREGFTLREVFEAPDGKSRKRGKVLPKYSNPEFPSQVWSGRGKQPLWFAAAIRSGKRKEDLLISAAPDKAYTPLALEIDGLPNT